MIKKISYIAGISILAYFFALILSYAWVAFVGDYSLQPVHEPDVPAGKSARPPVYLISYASGPVYYRQNQNAMVASAVNKGIDFIHTFRKELLPESFFEKYEAFFKKYGPNGLWIWKPYLIDKMLGEIPEGAYLVYLDSNFILRKPLTPLLKHLEDHDLILVNAFGKHQTLGEYVKGDVLKEVGCLSEDCRTSTLFASGVLFLKNTERTRAFIKRWFHLCEEEQLLANTPSHYPNHPEFKFHFHEGGILSSLFYATNPSAKILTMKELYDYMFWTHRKGSAKKLKPHYTMYGVKDTTWFRTSGSALTSVSILNFPPLVYLRRWVHSMMYGRCGA